VRLGLFDPKGYGDIFKTLTSANERMTPIFIESATKSTDIAADTAKEAFSNLREVTAVRDEQADYGNPKPRGFSFAPARCKRDRSYASGARA